MQSTASRGLGVDYFTVSWPWRENERGAARRGAHEGSAVSARRRRAFGPRGSLALEVQKLVTEKFMVLPHWSVVGFLKASLLLYVMFVPEQDHFQGECFDACSGKNDDPWHDIIRVCLAPVRTLTNSRQNSIGPTVLYEWREVATTKKRCQADWEGSS